MSRKSHGIKADCNHISLRRVDRSMHTLVRRACAPSRTRLDVMFVFIPPYITLFASRIYAPRVSITLRRRGIEHFS